MNKLLLILSLLIITNCDNTSEQNISKCTSLGNSLLQEYNYQLHSDEYQLAISDKVIDCYTDDKTKKIELKNLFIGLKETHWDNTEFDGVVKVYDYFSLFYIESQQILAQ